MVVVWPKMLRRRARRVAAAAALAVAIAFVTTASCGFVAPLTSRSTSLGSSSAWRSDIVAQQAEPQRAAYPGVFAATGAAFAVGSLALRRRRRTTSPVTRGYSPPTGPVLEFDIVMKETFDGKIGVAIQQGRRTVSRLSKEGAFELGWRVGDIVTRINDNPVDDNDQLKEAVKAALAKHEAVGEPISFTVKRRTHKVDLTQSMLRMTPGTGGALSVSMRQLIAGLVNEFLVVIFTDGTVKMPNNNLSALAVEALKSSGLAFKAVDCADEKYNPGVRAAMEEMTGEFQLPQLFVNGQRFGNGYAVEAVVKDGSFRQKLIALGAVPAETS